ncbi:hypothetical protein [Burkholderia sp. FERM BP-3421]|uniref:hypothetical protein n=1 Tax=Burkholderia sp. FERM BP-3421 TaxID=1494466 RepID=UPI002361F5A9|nr:hypothetical protein [Burkholderia sp. FERM BP-3421]
MQRALPMDVWAMVRARLAEHGEGVGPQGPDWRVARALVLLMGDAGLRIEEAVTAKRGGLQWWPTEDETPATWILRVICKGNKERFVPVTEDAIDALREHWRDRGLDLDAGGADVPLVAPTVVPPMPARRDKLGVNVSGEVTRVAGYTSRGARRVVLSACWRASPAPRSGPFRSRCGSMRPRAARPRPAPRTAPSARSIPPRAPA